MFSQWDYLATGQIFKISTVNDSDYWKPNHVFAMYQLDYDV